ncbi:MAG: response regulator [Planctomycetales bacterium]|nr:response regulator [Planctomycetales bacterium]
MPKKKILIVEDDTALSDILRYNFEHSGFDVVVAADGREALRQSHVVTPDVVILDIMLPELDGLEVCRRLRSSTGTRDVLIVMLTAKAEELDQLVGFSVGADDYVTKPFSVKVLLQRIKALLRRQETQSDDREVIVNQGIVIDRKRHQVKAGDEVLALTKSEFALLETLVRNPGRAYTRSELIDAALGDDAIVLERTIDVHVRALRKKLGPFAKLVETVRGVGYRFHDPRSS